MRILINDKPVDQLTPKQEKTFFLAKVQREVKGRILTSDEATAAYIGQTRQWFMIFGAIGLVLMVGVVVAGFVGEPKSGPYILLFALVLIAAMAFFMRWMLGRRVRLFSGKLEHRREGLMPVGTVLAIDADGLSVGPDTYAWPTLSIDCVELTSGSMPSGDTSTPIMIVERMAVATAGKVFVLDRALVENGQLLVDNTWRRLRAAAG